MFSYDDIKHDIESAEARTENIMRIIDSSNKYAPRAEFSIIVKEHGLAYLPYVYLSVIAVCLERIAACAADGYLLVCFLTIILLMTIVVLGALFSNNKKASVKDKYLNIKGKNWSYDEIERIIVYGRNYIYVYSCGKKILSLGMGVKCSDELIKWAKFYDIPIKMTSDSDMSKGKRFLISFLGILAFALIVCVFLRLVFR